MDARQIGQMQTGRRLLNKGRFFGHGIHAMHRQLRAANGKHHAGQAAATAHIQQPRSPRLGGQMALQGGHRRQTIEQMVGEHFLRVAHRRQVVHLVPLLQQV